MPLSSAQVEEMRALWQLPIGEFQSQILDDLPDPIGEDITRVAERARDEKGAAGSDPFVSHDFDLKPLREFVRVEIEERVRSFLASADTRLRLLLCEELEYCARRHVLDEDAFELAVCLADAFMTTALPLPIPATHLGVYLMKNHVLDPFCGCEPAPG